MISKRKFIFLCLIPVVFLFVFFLIWLKFFRFPNYNSELCLLSEKMGILENSQEGAMIVEKTILKRFENHCKRNELGIKIRLKNGTWFQISDTNQETDRVLLHSLFFYFEKLGFYLVYVQRYEGFFYELISEENGQSYKIDGIPIFSKNGEYALVISKDLISNYNPNSLEIINFNSKGVSSLFKKQVEWGPSNPKWVDNRTVLIDKVHYQLDKDREVLIGHQKISINGTQIKVITF